MARFLIQLHQARNLHYDLRLESAALADGHEGVRDYGGRSRGAIVWDEGAVEFLRDEPAHVRSQHLAA